MSAEPREETTADVPEVPAWLHRLQERFGAAGPETTTPVATGPETAGRPAAVLILFGDEHPGPATGSDRRGGAAAPPPGADVLLLRRAGTLRSHSGQVAFPGGATDPEDADAIATALREAVEETGLDPDGVRVFGALPTMYIPPSGFSVTPILGYWWRPSPVRAMDAAETEVVVRTPLRDLIDPANRFCVRRPAAVGGFAFPAFEVDGMLVWGFTAGVISAVLDAAGWTIPWPTDDIRDLDEALDRLAPGPE